MNLPVLAYTCGLPAFALETLITIAGNIMIVHLRDVV